MTENEAIKHLKLCKTSRLFIPNNDVLEIAIKSLEEIQQYRAIGTIEEFKALKEKNTPMKHHHTRIDNISDEIRVSVCPNCLSIMYTHSEEYPVFCNVCGQKLDWQ